MNLVTEHLTIRELRMEDLEQFDRLGNSDFVLQYLCMFKMDREGSRNYLQQMIANQTDFAIASKEDDRLIGKIHVDEDHLRYDVNSIDLAYWLGGGVHPQRVYDRSAHRLHRLPVLGQALRFHLSAGAGSPTLPPQALLRKLGFRQEGYLHRALRYNDVVYDNVLFSLQRDEISSL